MKLKTKLKAIMLLAVFFLPSSIHAEENPDADVIWIGNGSYVHRNPSDGKVTNADVASLQKIRLWQKGNEKYFTIGDDNDTPLTTFYKNPDYTKTGSKGYLSRFEYIIETQQYGKIYTNPDMNGNPMDYYSSEKKRRLGIVYPVYAEAVKRNAEGRLVYDTSKEKLRMALYRIGDSEDYYAMCNGKRYEIKESESPKTMIKERNVQYYQISFNGRPYVFKFNKL